MNYAVFTSGGKQYKVSEGDIVELDLLTAKPESKVNLSEVLLFVSDQEVKIGTPKLEDVEVSGTVVSANKGDKIKVAKYKAKSKYRRTKGFRASLTQVRIDKIAKSDKK